MRGRPDPNSRDSATCSECHATFEQTRAGHETCSTRCRQARSRRLQREAVRDDVRDFLRRHGHGHWLRDPLTPEQVAAHALATAERS